LQALRCFAELVRVGRLDQLLRAFTLGGTPALSLYSRVITIFTEDPIALETGISQGQG